jgi:hypothetical protein
MIRVISSPSSSTIGFLTWILGMGGVSWGERRGAPGARPGGY